MSRLKVNKANEILLSNSEFKNASLLTDFEVSHADGCKENVAALYSQGRREREFLRRSTLFSSSPHSSPYLTPESRGMCYLAIYCVKDHSAWKGSQKLISW